MRSIFALVVICIFALTIAAQTEPGQPPSPPVYSTQGAVNDPAPLPPPLVGSPLPPTTTPFPTARVTPTLWLPTSEPPPGCLDCAGQQPGIVFALLELFSRIIREFS